MNRQTAVQWLIVLASVVMVVGVGATYVNAQTKRTIAAAQRASREQGQATLAVVCAAFIAQDEWANDPDNPPETERARNNAQAWHELRVRFCG